MERLLRSVGMALALAAAPVSLAQTSYEQIQVGAVLRGDIGLGTFQKPLPLPEGEWLVVGNKSEAQPLTQGAFELSTPKVTLTLKSSASDNPISSLVVTFVPFPSRVSWQSGKCENTNPAVFVDDFGTTTSSMTYLCAQARAVSRFKSVVAAARTSSNACGQGQLVRSLAIHTRVSGRNPLDLGLRKSRSWQKCVLHILHETRVRHSVQCPVRDFRQRMDELGREGVERIPPG